MTEWMHLFEGERLPHSFFTETNATEGSVSFTIRS